MLTYNLQDLEPWKQTSPCYQTAVYEADAAGLVPTTLMVAPVRYGSEDEARQGHAATVANLRARGQGKATVARIAVSAPYPAS